MKRVLCLYLPFLSTDRQRRPDSVPGATITPQGQVLRIVHANHSAFHRGIRPGQTLADAKALVPELVTHDDDPAADRRRLESLAVWAGCLSPVVHLEDENTLLVDVTGCVRLFEGEPNLLRQALAGMKAEGFSARGAIADTLGAAWAVAHTHSEPAVIVPPGQTAAELVALPVWSLRIAPKTTRTLAAVGVQTIASLLHLPRSSLTSRFGEALLDRLDQALGDLPEPLTPYRPRPALTSRFHFGSATTRIDVLTEATRLALTRFCGQLARKVAGVRQVFITFYCPEVITGEEPQTRTITREINLSQPTRSAEHLFSLLTVLIDKLRLPGPADALMLWARRIDPLDGWQDELFATEAHDARELGDLVDRLTVRLGPGAVVRPQLLSEHQPERAFRYVSLVGSAKAPAGLDVCPAGPRPLRLPPRPLEIVATAVVPEGPPVSFRLHGTLHTVVKSIGPERIETGWWRGPHVQRDYYRVTTEAGQHGWVFRCRESNRWFLHGWFD